jgi:hypothetical protein
VLWCWAGLWIASHSRLCINGPSEPGHLTDVCVCQWVKCYFIQSLQLQLYAGKYFHQNMGLTILFAADACVPASCTIIGTQQSLYNIVHRSKKYTLRQNKSAATLFIYVWSNKHTIKCSHKFWNHNLQKQCHRLHQGNRQSHGESPFCVLEMR